MNAEYKNISRALMEIRACKVRWKAAGYVRQDQYLCNFPALTLYNLHLYIMSSPPITDRIAAITNQIKDTVISAIADTNQLPPKVNMSTDYKFAGWMGTDKESANGKMVWQEYEPKTWTENDVDIQITHCGICGSDLHTLRSGWGPTQYPCCGMFLFFHNSEAIDSLETL